MRDLRGLVGVCSQGKHFLICGRKNLPWGEAWVGFDQETGEPRSSRDPTIIDEVPSEAAKAAMFDAG